MLFKKVLPAFVAASILVGVSASVNAVESTPAPSATLTASATPLTDVNVDTVPNAPIGLYASSSAIGSVTLSWVNPSSNSTLGVTDFVVQYKKASDSTWLTFNDGVSTTTKATVTGLSSSTNYNFQVAAVNSSGTSAYTPYITVLSKANGIPDPPTNVSGIAPTPTSIYLTWTAPAKLNGGILSDYIVLYKLNTATTWSTWNDGVGTTAETTVTGLTAGQRYQFKVASKSSYGTSAYTALIAVGTVVAYLPGSITTVVAAGDSISRGFDINLNCALKDCPQYAWSTGTTGSAGTVTSIYSRIKTLNGTTATTALNVAKTGAKVADLDRQLKLVPTGTKTNVNIMIGANDLCTTSTGTITSTVNFTTAFETALTNYIARNPDAKIYLSSIPNINGLYNTFSSTTLANTIWNNAKVCPTALPSTTATTATRAVVATREAEFNNALKTACTVKFVKNCRWDNMATYNYVFTASDVSTVDYFHPSVAGQNKIAALAWKNSFWGS